jgi:hypothetical protein
MLPTIRLFFSSIAITAALFVLPSAEAAEVPFRLELAPPAWSKDSALPQLQAYACATGSDGRWLLMCGRTAGLHGFAGTSGTAPLNGNFAYAAMNPYAYVVDPTTGKVTQRLLQELVPTDLASTLMVTNPQFTQAGKNLIVCGGYGYTANQKGMLTQPLATVIDVDATIAAIVNGTTAGKSIRQTKTNALFQVAGGELLQKNDTFYLVFGQNFGGFYTPDTNGDYTFETRWFQLDTSTDPVDVKASGRAGGPGTSEFRRRDLNVVPALRSDGTWGISVYGGVFTKANGVWQQPVYIDPTPNGVKMTLDTSGFQQKMNQYAAASLVACDSKDKSMYTVIFGGIGLVSYNPSLKKFFSDSEIPFVDQVSCVRRDNSGASAEFLLMTSDSQPLTYPNLQGPEAKLLPALKSRDFYKEGILDLRKVQDRSLVGYIFGGIATTKPNRGKTTATNTVFEVYLTPQPAPALPVALP